MINFLKRKLNQLKKEGFFKNPVFYFKAIPFVLLGLLLVSSNSLAQLNSFNKNALLSYSGASAGLENNQLFFNQNNQLALEAPDLKIIQDDFVSGISTPRVLTTQTLGDIFGGNSQPRKDVENYVTQPGDTIESVAASFNISTNTILWANNLSKGSPLKVGQSLTILPVSGVLHIVKSGDTVADIAKTYKANPDDIIAINSLANEGDIFIGDILIIPGGVMPQRALSSNNQIPLPDNFFIFPAEGIITQGLHYYNAVDLANKCGTPIYAAASGVVQRAVFNNQWNLGMGNYVTILHSNGTVTYYGHFENVFVKPGQTVAVGDRIGLMGETGNATGCHVHFEVIGAANPLAKYALGALISYK